MNAHFITLAKMEDYAKMNMVTLLVNVMVPVMKVTIVTLILMSVLLTSHVEMEESAIIKLVALLANAMVLVMKETFVMLILMSVLSSNHVEMNTSVPTNLDLMIALVSKFNIASD